MTRYSFKVLDSKSNTIYAGCEGRLVLEFEMMGYVIQQFYDGVQL